MRQILFILFIGLTSFLSKGLAQNFNESEPNNTPLTANRPTLPSTLVGSFQQNGDIDYFQVTVTRGGVLTLSGTNNDGSRLQFQVFDGNQNRLTSQNSGAVNQPLVTPCLVRSGTFFISISDWNGGRSSSGGYQVQMLFDTTDICEYNGTFNTACTVPVNTTVTGKIWGFDGYAGRRSSVDNDLYKINVTRGGVLRLNIQQLADGQRPVIKVFNNEQRQLVSQVSPSGVTNFSTAANIPEAGTYYFEVSDWNDNQFNQQYSLNVQFETTIDNCEYNNNLSRPCDYTIGQIYEGKLCGIDGNEGAASSTDSDFFVFTASTTGIHNFRISNISPANRIAINIYNDAQQQVSSGVSPGGVTVFNHTYNFPRTGRYYAALTEWNGNQMCNSTYRFQIGLATSIKESNLLDFSASPNPVSHLITISAPDTEGLLKRFQIINLAGVQIYEKEIDASYATINVLTIPAGLYFLKVETTDGKFGIKKIVKQ